MGAQAEEYHQWAQGGECYTDEAQDSLKGGYAMKMNEDIRTGIVERLKANSKAPSRSLGQPWGLHLCVYPVLRLTRYVIKNKLPL
jgi:hypothetical protein